jgi:pyrophosphatase PpaX
VSYTTFLFDLDGTVLDSIELILRSYRHTLQTHLGIVPPDELWLKGLGTPIWVQLRHWTEDPEQIAAMVETYRTYNMAHHDALVRPYDGIVGVVEDLKARGSLVGLVTSKQRTGAERGLAVTGLAPSFDVIVGADEVVHPKPHPEPVLVALERLGARAESAVFIGDSRHDLVCGRAAQVATGAALWGPFTRADLEDLNPDYWLERPSDVSTLL